MPIRRCISSNGSIHRSGDSARHGLDGGGDELGDLQQEERYGGGGVPVRRFPDVQRRSDPSRMLGAGDPSLIKNILITILTI